MKKIFFSLFIISLIIFAGCQKKSFKNVVVKGRIIHAATNEPYGDAEVCLYGDDATSSKSSTRNTIKLKCTFTASDGSFTIKSKASKRSPFYYLWVEGYHIQLGVQQYFTAEDNTTKDLGEVYVDL